MFISVDIGSGMTKAIQGNNEFACPSLVGRYKSHGFDLGTDKSDVISVKGERWIVGDSAEAHVRSSELESTLSKKWHKTDAYLMLFYRSVAAVIPEGFEGRLGVCTGAPVRYFDEAKKDLVKSLVGHHRFKAGDNEYNFYITDNDLVLAPQVVGLYFAELDFKTGPVDKVKGYFDFGTYTSGFALFDGKKYVKWGEGGEEIGGGALARLVGARIKEVFDVEISQIAATNAISNREILIQGAKEDVGALVDGCAREIMKPLTENFKQKWKEASLESVTVGGGYGKLFFSAVKRELPFAELASKEAEGLMGVVRGYDKYFQLKRMR